jgi:hypothetical protein
MSYIGNQPLYQAFLTDQFNGTGSATTFTMSVAPANPGSVLVVVSGVLQDPTTYSVSGTTLTFTGAPPAGTANISVRYMGIPASGVTTTAYRTVTEFTATAGQTTFTPPSYTVGYIAVYRNGVRLGSADFTASNGTTVVLALGASVNDLVVTESFYVSSVVNAIPATANSVIDLYVNQVTGSKIIGSQSIPKSTLPTGSLLQMVNANYSTSTSTTSSSFTDLGLSASITPTSSTSKILCIANINGVYKNGHNGSIGLNICRSTTQIVKFADNGLSYTGTSGASQTAGSVSYVDSPATTSSTTYKIQFKNGASSGGSVVINDGGGDVSSTLILMEIAQ